MTGVGTLWLNNNQINDVSPLSTLTGLEWMGLNNNQINDISPLSTLTGLNMLWLGDNKINEEQKQDLREKLPDCRIRD